MGKFCKTLPQETSTGNDNPPPLKDIPARAGTPWPETGSASENLFESRSDWTIPLAPTPTPIVMPETRPHDTEIPCTTIAPKQLEEKCGWGPNCPICKNDDQHEEDWDDDLQNQKLNAQHPQQDTIHTQPQYNPDLQGT